MVTYEHTENPIITVTQSVRSLPPIHQPRDRALGWTPPLACTGLWVTFFPLSLSFLKGKRRGLSYSMSVLVLPDISACL